MIKAIAFDMDGVLIDAQEWHYVALNKALRLFGVEISRLEHDTQYDGLPTREKLKQLTEAARLPYKLHNLINDIKQLHTVREIELCCAPIFQHQYMLSKLRQDGYQICCASNSIRQTITMMLTKADLINRIDFFLSAEDVPKGKPDPDIYIAAARKFGVIPAEMLVIEDNEKGVFAAQRAGARCMQVSSVSDVSYTNVVNYIDNIEAGK